MGDRIEAGTYLLAGAITGGDVTVKGAPVEAMSSVLAALQASGCTVETAGDEIRCVRSGALLPVDISTQPHPGFPTDMQAQWVALMTQAEGESTVQENIFENRFMHVAELSRMGAPISLSGNTATIAGPEDLTGATVMATDLRASASLVLAGLAAHGTTEMLRLYHLDRGYERLLGKLEQIGAKIRRVSEDTPIQVGLPSTAAG